ncbi:hypothetical protein B0E51_01170 [Rhodanobacter sp. C05]|nr:hypothetical protein B0E51_01170 [Rhodanobacter sp. C05]
MEVSEIAGEKYMELELYVREGCSRCKRVRETLDSMGIEASVVDIDAPEVTARARALGIRSVPVLHKLGTKEMKVGDVSEDELRAFLG